MPPKPVRIATPDRDNQALCALARLCPQGRHWRFYHRRDDYWERGRLHRESQVLVIDHDGQLAAAATFARKSVWLGQAPRRAVYLFDVMVHPEQRGQGLARTLVEAITRFNTDADLFYCYILSDNEPSLHLFRSVGFHAYPLLLNYHPLLPAMASQRFPASVEEVRDTAAIDADLRARYDFLDTTVGHDAVFVLEEKGGRAWAALRKHEPQVFIDLPWYASVASRLVPLVPAPGRPVTVWSLHHLGWNNSSSGLPRRLIRSVATRAAREKIDALVIPLFENDPAAEIVRPLTLTPWGVAPGRVRLFAAGPLAPLLFATRRPLVMSGQDG